MKLLPFIDLLKQKYPLEDRERIMAKIFCGEARFNDEVCRDPKQKLRADVSVTIIEPLGGINWVSRGAHKLLGLIDEWSIEVKDLVVLDAGSSTGGFTQVLLERGARLVHAIDVGTNQLDYKLRADPRVALQEKTNISAITSLDPMPDFAVCDLSFTSLVKPAVSILALTKLKVLYALIKPQFERASTNLDRASFDGIVPESEHEAILVDLRRRLEAEGLTISRITESKLRGGKGNKEYFAHINPS